MCAYDGWACSIKKNSIHVKLCVTEIEPNLILDQIKLEFCFKKILKSKIVSHTNERIHCEEGTQTTTLVWGSTTTLLGDQPN